VPDRNDAHPAFSSDGTLLVFHGYQGEQATQSCIYVLNVSTGRNNSTDLKTRNGAAERRML